MNFLKDLKQQLPFDLLPCTTVIKNLVIPSICCTDVSRLLLHCKASAFLWHLCTAQISGHLILQSSKHIVPVWNACTEAVWLETEDDDPKEDWIPLPEHRGGIIGRSRDPTASNIRQLRFLFNFHVVKEPVAFSTALSCRMMFPSGTTERNSGLMRLDSSVIS